MRIVLDTNIYIAAGLKGEFSGKVLDKIIKSPDLVLVTSEEILSELEEKLQRKFVWQQERIGNLIAKIKESAQIAVGTERITKISRDPEDNKILECAVSGNADLIVSLDQDLIKLKKFRKIGIVHPKTFSWTFP